jgi:hypothetical protein
VSQATRPPAVETQPQHPDERLRGRTYAIPFEDVWRAALYLAGGGLRGWRLIAADDEEGIILAEASTLALRFVDDVSIRVRLDEDAQTRVDVRSASRVGRNDFGTNARRVARFLDALDQRVPLETSARRGAAEGRGHHDRHPAVARR